MRRAYAADTRGNRAAGGFDCRRLHEGFPQAEVNATRWNRREVLGGVIAAGALSGTPFRRSLGQQPVTERKELLIRNGYVLTMDAAGDIAGGDVHVRDGAIAAVGRGLSAPGAEVIDGTGMLVLP